MKYLISAIYYLLYPFAWIVYKIRKLPFAYFAIDLMSCMRTKSEYMLIRSVVKVESNDGTSNYAQTLNNLIGMHKVQIRPTYQNNVAVSGDGGTMGGYDNWALCIADFWLWYEYNNLQTHKDESFPVLLGFFIVKYNPADTTPYMTSAAISLFQAIEDTRTWMYVSIAFFFGTLGMLWYSVRKWKKKPKFLKISFLGWK